MLDRQQDIWSGFLRVDDLGDLIHHALEIDSHLMADAVEGGDRAIAFFIP